MSGFNKRAFTTRVMNFIGTRTVNILGRPDSTEKLINLAFNGFVRTNFSRVREDVFGVTGAHTLGIAAVSSTAVLSATALTAAEQTILPAGLTISTLDFPRVIRVAGSGSTGDGTMAGSGARMVKVVGTDQFDRVIQEWIPLNGTSAANGTLAFKTITSVVLPAYTTNGSETVGVGFGATIGFRGIPLATPFQFERKASAATAFTLETSPSTVDITPLMGTLQASIATTDTTLTIASGDTWTSGAQRCVARIYAPDGDYETVMVTDNTSQTLTVVRSVGGSNRAWPKGSVIVKMPGFTFTTTITAADRLKVQYLTKYL